MRQRPRPGRATRPGWGWRRVGAVLASVLGPALVGEDVEAAQRRATLGVKLRVLGSCSATSGSGRGGSVDPVCARMASPVLRVEAAGAVDGDGGGGAAGIASARRTTVGPDGVRYLTVIY